MGSSGVQTVTTEVSEEVGEFLWKIQNYFLVQQHKNLVEQQQLELEVGKLSKNWSKWLVGLKANTERKCIKFYARLLDLAVNTSDVFVKIEVENSNDTEHVSLTKFQGVVRKGMEVVLPYNFSFKSMRRSSWDLSLNDEGDLERRIKIAVVTTKVDDSATKLELAMEKFKTDSAAKLQKNFGAILYKDSGADVKIVCSDGVEFFAHSIILSAQSPVFCSMLAPDNKYVESANGVVHIPDISGKTMKIVLHFLYTGKLQKSWCNSDIIHEFAYAAGKYQLTEVLAMLDSILGIQDNIEYDLALLGMVQKLQLKNAETQIMERIVKLAISADTSDNLLTLFNTTL